LFIDYCRGCSWPEGAKVKFIQQLVIWTTSPKLHPQTYFGDEQTGRRTVRDMLNLHIMRSYYTFHEGEA